MFEDLLHSDHINEAFRNSSLKDPQAENDLAVSEI